MLEKIHLRPGEVIAFLAAFSLFCLGAASVDRLARSDPRFFARAGATVSIMDS